MIELTKSQKKVARILIDRALQRECAGFIKEMHRLTQPCDKTSHEQYLAIFKAVYQFDKHVAGCYDGLTGSRYFPTVLNLYFSSVLNDDDLTLFDEGMQVRLKELKIDLTR